MVVSSDGSLDSNPAVGREALRPSEDLVIRAKVSA
jgi:hypothetical protein